MKAQPQLSKPKARLDRWVSAALGLLCLFLLAYLVRHSGVWAQAPAPPSKPGGALSASARGQGRRDELAQFDPVVKLELLNELQSRPAPHFSRNPFEYPAPKLPPAPPVVTTPTPPATPVPPPPPPLKALGFMEKAGGVREATLTDEADNIYVVHENETFATRYKVLKITPTVIEIEDTTTQQTLQLPVPE
jgi:hypothetical protein